jgi:hypothetical protein
VTIEIKEVARIPVISVDSSSVGAFKLFNPNLWTGDSKAIVLSASTVYSMLQYSRDEIVRICISPIDRCRHHFERLRASWGPSVSSVSSTRCLAQDPQLHLQVAGFFSGMKSLLDLVVQLLNSEGVVAASVHGFHKSGEDCGGTVLNALARNCSKEKRELANRTIALIKEHKSQWIDSVIGARDDLVHPKRGMHQVMFEMHLGVEGSSLAYLDASPPTISGERLDQYASSRLADATRFSEEFLSLLR